MIVMRIFGLLGLSLLVLASGCGHDVVPSTAPREAVSAQTVRIYQDYPRKFEKLGTVTLLITPDLAWDKRGHADAVIDRLKAQAAALGANGLLLMVDDLDSFDYLATAGYGKRQFYRLPMRAEPETAIAEAIYVIEEQ